MKDERPTTRTRNIQYERIWSQYQHECIAKSRQANTTPIAKPVFKVHNREAQKRDEINFPDDTTLRVSKSEDIYPELKDFRGETAAYKLPIDWNKVVVLVKKMTMRPE